MNKRRFYQKVAVVLIAALVLTGFSMGQTGVKAAKKKIPKLSKSSLTLTVGQSKKLTVKNSKGSIKWKTSSKKIASVSKKGVVKALKAGKTVISATVKVSGKKKTLKCKLTVKAKTKAAPTQAPQTASEGTNAQTPGGQTGGNTTGGNTNGGSTGGNIIPVPNVTPTPIPNVTPTPIPNVTPTPVPNVTPTPEPASDETYTITGVFKRNGVPEGNVQLTFLNQETEEGGNPNKGKTFTLADGSYSIRLKKGTYHVYEKSHYEGEVSVTGNQQTDLNYSGYHISGRITDAQGNGISNLEVSVNTALTSSTVKDISRYTTTDSNGDFSLYYLPTGTYELKANGQFIKNINVLEDISGITHQTTASGISGTVKDVKGTLVGGTEIGVYTEDDTCILRGKTSEDGKYQIALPEGRYFLKLHNSQYQEESEIITVESGMTSFDFNLSRQIVSCTLKRKGIICVEEGLSFYKKTESGTTWDSSCRYDPDEGMKNNVYAVWLEPGNSYDVHWQGKKVGTINVPLEGEVTGTELTSDLTKVNGKLRASDNTLLTQSGYMVFQGNTHSVNVSLNHGEFTTFLESGDYDIMFLDKKVGTYTVTDTDAVDIILDLPLYKVSGTLSSKENMMWYYVQTAEYPYNSFEIRDIASDNSFSVYLPNGTYIIKKYPVLEEEISEETKPGCSQIITVDNRAVENLSINMNVQALHATANVNGEKLSGEKILQNVFFTKATDSVWKRILTAVNDGNDGIYITLPIGTYHVIYKNKIVDTITIKEGANQKDINIYDYTVQGKVYDGDGNDYECNIHFYDEADNSVGEAYNTAEEGYSISFTKAGTYQVKINGLDCGQIVIDGTKYSITKDITYPIYQISGQLKNSKGEPVTPADNADFYINTIYENGTRSYYDDIDVTDSGMYAVTGLFPGTYEFVYGGDSTIGYSDSETLGTVTITNQSVTRNFRVKGSHTVSGKLETKGGTPIANALLEFYQNSTYIDEVETDDDGSYSITLKAGTYDVKWNAMVYNFDVVEQNLGTVTVDTEDVKKDIVSDLYVIRTKVYRASELFTSSALNHVWLAGDKFTETFEDFEKTSLLINDDGYTKMYVKGGTYTITSNYCYTHANDTLKSSKEITVSNDMTEPIVLEGTYQIAGTLYTDGTPVSDRPYIEIRQNGEKVDEDYCNSNGTFELYVHSLGDFTIHNESGKKIGEVSLTEHKDASGVVCNDNTAVVPSPTATPVPTEKQHLVDLSEVRYGTTEGRANAYIRDNNLFFTKATYMNYIDLSDYLTNSGIDLTDYDSMEVNFDVFDSAGEQVAYNGTTSILKAALVPANNLDGYTNLDQYITKWPSSNGTMKFDLTSLSESLVSAAKGMNLQLNTWDKADSGESYAKSLDCYTLRINYILLNKKEITYSDDDISRDARGNITVNLASSYLTFAGKSSTEITPEVIDGSVYFGERATKNSVDFSALLTNKSIDLTTFSGIEVDCEFLDSNGDVIDTSSSYDIKLALVDSSHIDGASDGIGDANREEGLFTKFCGGKATFTLPASEAADVAQIAGLNMQLCTWNAGFGDLGYDTLHLKSIRFIK